MVAAGGGAEEPQLDEPSPSSAWVIILLVTARHRELELQPTGDNMNISAITTNIEELYA